MKRILTIAGSDSGGGAGVQADLKAITLLGGFGMSVITGLTAQNTMGVQGVYPVSPEFVEKQMDAVILDIGVDAAKTGMLVNSKLIRVVADRIRKHRVEKLVVDPVMVAKGGESLLAKEGIDTLSHELIPLAFVITPNLPEASAICGRTVENHEDMKEAARDIYRKGARNVLIKGGHLPGRPIDILFDGENFFEYSSERISTKNTHGTGCVFSAALAFEVANGRQVHEAIKKAKDFVTKAIQNALPLGKGCGPVNPYGAFSMDIHRYQVISEVKEAIKTLKEAKIGRLIPEVQSNLAMALPQATKVEDIAAIPGRIIRIGDHITTVSDPEFGASQHIARIILTLMRYNDEMRSAMNIRYSEDIVRRCKDSGLNVRSLDRATEPEYSKKKEGSSLAWIVENAVKEEKRLPDVIYDAGDLGKEPMVRVVGKDAREVVEKVLRIAK